MSERKTSTARPKTGSVFKVPGNIKGIEASTPRHTENKNAALSCDLSVIKPATAPNQRASHQPLPRAKVSTPIKEEKDDNLSCDISAIQLGAHGGSESVPAAKKALYKHGNETLAQVRSKKMLKQMELDKAYNNYLIAFHQNNIIEEKHYADTKNQIEADLGALTKRLALNQLNLETTKQRISKISFRSEQDRALRAQGKAVASTLDHMEGGLERKISALGEAIDAKANNLEMRNITTGTAELKKILADSNQILNQLKASNPIVCSERMSTGTDLLASTVETMKHVNTRYERIVKKMPAYNGAPVFEHMARTINAKQNVQRNEEGGDEGLDGDTSSVSKE